MRHDQVTSPAAPQVTPIVYLDLDIGDDSSFQEEIASYPGMRHLMLAEHGPGGGNPVYRVEGPLDSLAGWLLAQYNSGDCESSLDLLRNAKLAR